METTTATTTEDTMTTLNITINPGVPARMAGATLNVARCMQDRAESMSMPSAWLNVAEALEEQAIAADECDQGVFAEQVRSDARDCRAHAARL